MRSNLLAFVSGCQHGLLRVKLTLKPDDGAEGGATAAARLLESLEMLRDACEARGLRPTPELRIGKDRAVAFPAMPPPPPPPTDKDDDGGSSSSLFGKTDAPLAGGTAAAAEEEEEEEEEGEDGDDDDDDDEGVLLPSSERLIVESAAEDAAELRVGSGDGAASLPPLLLVEAAEAEDGEWIDMAAELTELEREQAEENREDEMYPHEMALGGANVIDGHY
jgi:hypothetical protein